MSRAASDRTVSNPFAKNRDFYVSCVCTVVEGLFSGFNFMLIWLVMHQVFSGEIDLQALLSISAAIVAVFVARLAVYRFGYVRGQVGGARVSRDLRILMGDTIKRIPLSRFADKTGGEYLQALTVNVNDYEQILTHRTGEIIKSAVLAAMLGLFTVWLYAPAYPPSRSRGGRSRSMGPARTQSGQTAPAPSWSMSTACRPCAPTGWQACTTRPSWRACANSRR